MTCKDCTRLQDWGDLDGLFCELLDKKVDKNFSCNHFENISKNNESIDYTELQIKALLDIDFNSKHLQQITDLKEHLEMQIKLIGCGEYLDGIELSSVDKEKPLNSDMMDYFNTERGL